MRNIWRPNAISNLLHCDPFKYFRNIWVWKIYEKQPQVFYCRLVFHLTILILQAFFIWLYNMSFISMDSKTISRLLWWGKKVFFFFFWLIDLYIAIASKRYPSHAPTPRFVTKVGIITYKQKPSNRYPSGLSSLFNWTSHQTYHKRSTFSRKYPFLHFGLR